MTEGWKTFKFVDEHLQSSLIDAIRAAGLDYEVKEDGTVIYPAEHSIAKFTNVIHHKVFPETFYTATLSEKVAERYRQFKKYYGTPFIEEICGTEIRFIQEIHEKLYRYRGIPTHATYILAGKTLEPDQVTELLGISPTFSCNIGEPFSRPNSLRRKDAPQRLSSKGWWELCSMQGVEANDIEPHLEYLLGMLVPVSSELKSFVKKSTDNDFRIVQIFVVEPEGLGGLSLSRSLMERLNAISDRVDISFWPDDYIYPYRRK